MKILAFTDSHANKQVHAVLREKAKQADVVLCAGDISVFGMDLFESLHEMNSWNKPLFLIHGNHEDQDLLVDVQSQYPNITFVHADEKPFGNLVIWGWGGGGFAHKDLALERHAKKYKPHPQRIMLFHGPPHGTVADFKNEYEGHVGCLSRRRVIEQLQPLIVLCGHIHETFDRHEKLGRTLILNPGPIGKIIEIPQSARVNNSAKKTSKPSRARGGKQ
jgi:Icc-related predicted phosphoesterase